MSFLTSILPTAGGILGGIGGAALGTVAAPFTGGIINPIDAGIVGAGLGDTAGRAGQNVATHQNIKNDLGSSFVQGAAGQATGEVGGALLGGILGKVSSVGENAATSAMMKQAGGFLSKEDAQALLDRGVTNFGQATTQVPKITGAAGGDGAAFTNGVTNAMSNSSNPIDITQEAANWSDLLRPHSLSLSDKQISGLSDNINHSIGKMTDDSGNAVSVVPTSGKGAATIPVGEPGSLSSMKPGAVYTQAQELQRLGNSISQNASRDVYGNIQDPAKAAQAEIYKTLGNQLEQKATSSVPITAADKTMLKASLSSVKDDNPTLYANLSNDIDGAKNWQDVISQQALWVRVSKAQDALENVANKTAGNTPSDIASGTLGLTNNKAGVIKAGLGAITKSPAVNRAEAATLSQLPGLIGKGSADDAGVLSRALGVKSSDAGLIQKVLPLASRATAITMANLPNDVPTNVQSNEAVPTAQNGENPMNPSAAQNPLAQLYNEIIAQSQTPGGISGNLISTANSLAPVLQKQELAAPAISNALSTYNNAGGAQGTGQGLLTRLTGLIPGTPANTYANESNAAAAQLASILGISPQQAAALLPQLTQTPGAAAPQISGLQSILGNIGSTASAVPAQ